MRIDDLKTKKVNLKRKIIAVDSNLLGIGNILMRFLSIRDL